MRSSINGFNSGGENREEKSEAYKLKTPRNIANKVKSIPYDDVIISPFKIIHYMIMGIIGLIGGIVLLMGYRKAKHTFTPDDDIMDKVKKVWDTKL